MKEKFENPDLRILNKTLGTINKQLENFIIGQDITNGFLEMMVREPEEPEEIIGWLYEPNRVFFDDFKLPPQ